jgi:U3 small nucleolar RNA-associated protein 20
VEETAAAPERSVLNIQLLGTVAGVRRGGRIQEWSPLVKAQMQSLAHLSTCKEMVEKSAPGQVWQRIIVNTAIVWAQAPIDALIPSINAFNGKMTKEPLMKWYIPFCSYLADLNSERFRSLFQKDFQRLVLDC